MPSGFLLALLAVAQAVSAGAPAAPAATSAPAAPPVAAQAATVPPPDRPDGCGARTTGGDSRTIVVCAPKPQGYRIDPDVLEARREAHGRVQPRRPDAETMQVNSCALVGPMGCRGNVGIDLANAAMVLGEMARRASEGGNVGQMFMTEPQQGEYQLYVEAKKRREAKEAQEAAAKAKAAALAPRTGSAAAPAAPPPQPPSTPPTGVR